MSYPMAPSPPASNGLGLDPSAGGGDPFAPAGGLPSLTARPAPTRRFRPQPADWKLPDAAEVIKLWRECDQELVEARRDFWLNCSFYLGEQWIKWEPGVGTAEALEFRDDEDQATRTTIDKFGPRIDSLTSRMTSTDLEFQCRPRGIDDDAIRRARIQDEILAGLYSRDNWVGTRATEVQDCVLGGTAAVAVEYDVDGQVGGGGESEAVDMVTSIPVPYTKVRLRALSIAEFGIEPGSRSAGDARYWITCTTLTPKQVQERYPDAFADKAPGTDATAASTPLYRALYSRRFGSSPSDNTTLVYCYYERPGLGPGGVVHVAGSKVVHTGPWPFDSDRLNLFVFRQREITGRWFGDTCASSARSPQQAYNRARTCIQRHIHRASNARQLIPNGSLDDGADNTDDPGEPWFYNSDITGEPHWELAPQVPRYLREEPGQLEQEIDDILHTHSVTRGLMPGDRSSGLAMSIAAEKDDTPLGRMSRDQQTTWQDIASFVLTAVKAHLGRTGGTDKVTRTTEGGTPTKTEYGADDIDEAADVHVPLEVTQPRSRAATQAAMVELQQAFPQLFANLQPSQLAKMMMLDDPVAFLASLSPDERSAQWENEMIEAGQVLAPQEFEDHQIHRRVHYDAAKSPAFRFWPPDRQEALLAHVDAHDQIDAELQAQQTPPPGPPPPEMGGAPGEMPPGMGGPTPGLELGDASASMGGPGPGGELPPGMAPGFPG